MEKRRRTREGVEKEEKRRSCGAGKEEDKRGVGAGNDSEQETSRSRKRVGAEKRIEKSEK
jgi:hypothetical protein